MPIGIRLIALSCLFASFCQVFTSQAKSQDYEYSQFASTATTESNVNFTNHRHRGLITANGKQYTAFYNSNNYIVVAVRDVDSAGQWNKTFIDASGVDLSDAHNTINIGIDPVGYIHLIYGLHNDPPNYLRSNNPYDISSFSTHSLGDQHLTSVTYPSLFSTASQLFLLYREGGSGNGAAYLLKYNTSTGTWAHIFSVPLLYSMIGGYTTSPYWDSISVDQRGMIHLSWSWRRISDENSNTTICYAKSPDQGLSWYSSKDLKYTLPISIDNCDVVDPVSENSGLTNQNSLSVDSNNYPHIAYVKNNSSGHKQLFHAYFDGSDWRIEQVSNDSFTPRRPKILIDKMLQAHVISFIEEQQRMYVWRSVGSDYAQWAKFQLSPYQVPNAVDHIVDHQRWDEDNTLQILHPGEIDPYQQIGVLTWISPTPTSNPEVYDALDFNNDTHVNILDFQIMLDNIALIYNDAYPIKTDIIKDNIVNIFDYNHFVSNY